MILWFWEEGLQAWLWTQCEGDSSLILSGMSVLVAHFSLCQGIFLSASSSYRDGCIIGNKYMYSYHSINESFRKWYNFLYASFHDDSDMIQVMTCRFISTVFFIYTLHARFPSSYSWNGKWVFPTIIIIINTSIMRMKRWSYGTECINNLSFTITSFITEQIQGKDNFFNLFSHFVSHSS